MPEGNMVGSVGMSGDLAGRVMGKREMALA
jgi:hypothetical protein